MTSYARSISGIYVVIEKIVAEAIYDAPPGAKEIISSHYKEFQNAAINLVGILELADAYNRAEKDTGT